MHTCPTRLDQPEPRTAPILGRCGPPFFARKAAPGPRGTSPCLSACRWTSIPESSADFQSPWAISQSPPRGTVHALGWFSGGRSIRTGLDWTPVVIPTRASCGIGHCGRLAAPIGFNNLKPLHQNTRGEQAMTQRILRTLPGTSRSRRRSRQTERRCYQRIAGCAEIDWRTASPVFIRCARQTSKAFSASPSRIAAIKASCSATACRQRSAEKIAR